MKEITTAAPMERTIEIAMLVCALASVTAVVLITVLIFSEGPLAMGASKWQMLCKASLPAAKWASSRASCWALGAPRRKSLR